MNPAFELLERPAASPAWRLQAAADPRIRHIARSEGANVAAPLHAWNGCEARARFRGSRIGLRLEPTRGVSHYLVEVDGQSHLLALTGGGPQDWVLREPLPLGEHELRLVKRSEGSAGEVRLHGLLTDVEGRLLPPPPPRALRLEFYGDSITAGACNRDPGDDQFDDPSTHDGTCAYGALTARQLDADYFGIAMSGIGITCSFHGPLMPQVFDRVAPRLDAPFAPVGPRQPDAVLVNLGQNDHAYPASRGEPFADDFAKRYLAFVRQLRTRHPMSKLVLLIGGMPAWQREPALQPTLAFTASALRAEGDTRVWTYTFQAFSENHPRTDIHEQMANELTAFLRNTVL